MTVRKRKILAENETEERSPLNKTYKDTGDRINQGPNEIRFVSMGPPGESRPAISGPLENTDPPDLYREIPIVVVSDEINPDMTDRVRALQIEHVIQKPYNSEFLKKNVNSLLEIQKKTDPQL